MSMIIIFPAVVLLLLVLIYPDRYIGTQSRPDLKGPRGLPLIGNLLLIYSNRARMIPLMKELSLKYGPLFTFSLPVWGRTVVINRPEWLSHIKRNDISVYSRGSVAISIFEAFPGKHSPVAAEGAAWRKSRKTVHPIFTMNSFQRHVLGAMGEIVPIVQSLLVSLSKQPDKYFDWNDLCGRIALSIFCKSSLDLNTQMLRPDPACLQECDVMLDAVNKLNKISATRLFNPYWKFTDKFDGTARIFDVTIKNLWAVIDGIITKRRLTNPSPKASQKETDFLTNLLQDPTVDDPLFIRDIIVTLLFGGRDNMQNSIAWSLYELSRKPEWIKRMREEAEERIRYGLVPDITSIHLYPIHSAVFFETIRLRPGLPKNARYACKDDVLPAIPEYGLPEVKISKGTYVLWSDLNMMREETVWGPDADSFNPGRHLNEQGKFTKPAPPNFVSFGAGPRLCPAAQLVLYQFVSIWAGILPYFEFEAKDQKETFMGDSLTASMGEPFMVKVKQVADISL